MPAECAAPQVVVPQQLAATSAGLRVGPSGYSGGVEEGQKLEQFLKGKFLGGLSPVSNIFFLNLQIPS